ncbi:MAG: hypothetical protein HY557_07950, partial [Euryarchaeota archaeon]|nr:hypothetical protein [Euryarchaeota archaeon]
EYNLTVEQAGYVTLRRVVRVDPRDVDPAKAAIDLGTFSLQHVEDVRPLLIAGIAIAVSAALVLAGVLRRRRDRFREHFEELEPEEGEAER